MGLTEQKPPQPSFGLESVRVPAADGAVSVNCREEGEPGDEISYSYPDARKAKNQYGGIICIGWYKTHGRNASPVWMTVKFHCLYTGV